MDNLVNPLNIHFQELTQKELKDQELVTLHKTVLMTYINAELRWDSGKKASIMKAYDDIVTRDNIRWWLNYKVNIFLIALEQGKLEDIANYTFGWEDFEEEIEEEDE